MTEQHPDAPPHINRVRLALLEKSGRPEAALEEWIRLAEASEGDGKVLGVAHRYIRELTAQILTERARLFAERSGRPPGSLDELVDAGLIEAVPPAPDGRSYGYDPATGVVTPPEAHVVKEAR